MLPFEFYQNEDVVGLARSLLGCRIVSEFSPSITLSGIIVETEAYRAPEDRASHAFNNRRTPRTETMYRAGGVAYIYLCYGIHHLFNVVTGPVDRPHAILIRAVQPIENIDTMRQLRGASSVTPRLTNGPGKWTRAMAISLRHNGLPLYHAEGDIRLLKRMSSLSEDDIVSSPRVGIDYAKEWKDKPWRFRIKGNPWVGK